MNRTSKRQGTGKFLALLASLAMVVAGLASVALASPASAAAPDQCDTANGFTFNDESGQCEKLLITNAVEDTENPIGYTCDDGWELEGTTCTKEVDPIVEYSCPSGWNLDGDTCYKKDCAVSSDENEHEDCTKPAKKNWYCPTVEDGDSNASVAGGRSWGNVTEGHSFKFGKHERSFHFGSRGCGEGEHPDKDKCELSVPADPIYKWICPTGTFPINDVKAQSVVQIGPDTKCGEWVYENPTCPAGQVYDEETNNCSVPVTPEFTATSGADVQACVAGAPQTVTVVASATGATKEAAIASAQLAAGNKAAAAIANLGGTAGACPGVAEVPPVVSTSVAAAAPATVAAAKPAKKPVSVAAPGTVSAGVATVSAPTKATVPSSVPAGDGSQAPTIPLWALALVAAGILGGALTGKQLVGARK